MGAKRRALWKKCVPEFHRLGNHSFLLTFRRDIFTIKSREGVIIALGLRSAAVIRANGITRNAICTKVTSFKKGKEKIIKRIIIITNENLPSTLRAGCREKLVVDFRRCFERTFTVCEAAARERYNSIVNGGRYVRFRERGRCEWEREIYRALILSKRSSGVRERARACDVSRWQKVLIVAERLSVATDAAMCA